MAKANVNVEDVRVFRAAIKDYQEYAEETQENFKNAFDSLKQAVNQEITRISTFCGKIEKKLQSFKCLLSNLSQQISDCEADLAYIEPTCIDEEGNIMPNPEYEAMEAKIQKLSDERESVRQKINDLQSLQAEANKKSSALKKADTNLNDANDKISNAINDSNEHVERAINLLDKIESILEGYLETSINGRGETHSDVNGGGSSQTVNEMKITEIGDPSSLPAGKKYTDGVIIEGDLMVPNGNRTKTKVTIKRKVHQYAPGIDLDYVRPDGKTNYEAMLKGDAPIVEIQTDSGVVATKLDLHHLTQEETLHQPNSQFLQGTLLEIPVTSHQKYTRIIHMRYPYQKGVRRSFRVVKLPNHKYQRSWDDKQFNAFRKQYWKTRALMLRRGS